MWAFLCNLSSYCEVGGEAHLDCGKWKYVTMPHCEIITNSIMGVHTGFSLSLGGICEERLGGVRVKLLHVEHIQDYAHRPSIEANVPIP